MNVKPATPAEREELDVSATLQSLTERALQAHDGNRTRAAIALGISVRTMRNWIRKFHLNEKFPTQSGKR